MLLGEPQRTPFDLNFPLLGIPVRVSPWFWLAALILGWDLTRGNGMLILLWVVAVFLSLLVHEFGHAMAFRYFGVSSHVVLYHFGGLAVPDSVYSAVGFGRSRDPWSQIAISAAGPGAQLLLVAVIVLLVRAAQYQVPLVLPFGLPLGPLGGGEPIPNDLMRIFVFFLLLPSLYWAVLNLIPVYPLDGGQIARELFLLFNVRDGIKNSLILSIVAGGALAVYGLMNGQTFLGIMFGLLAFSSYTMLQAYQGRGGGYGGGNPW